MKSTSKSGSTATDLYINIIHLGTSQSCNGRFGYDRHGNLELKDGGQFRTSVLATNNKGLWDMCCLSFHQSGHCNQLIAVQVVSLIAVNVSI